MSEIIKKYSDIFFDELVSKFGFEVRGERVNDDFHFIEYASKKYVIKIEKYHLELYPSVYSLSDQDNEINLFNLLGFLKQDDSHTPKSNFFRNEKNIEESFKKQLSHISGVIYNNLNSLDDFFSEDRYKRNSLEFHKYWKRKHPELYRKF